MRYCSVIIRCIRPALRLLALVLLSGLGFGARAQGPVNYADWKLEWAEEFNGPLDTTDLAKRWRFFYPWGHVINPAFEAGYYTGEGLQASNGVLNMTMRELKTPRQYHGKAMRYDTPMLISRHPVDSLLPTNCHAAEGFSYGLFEVRLKQPRYNESFPAFWLFGGTPDEIDIFESAVDVFSSNFHFPPHEYWRPARQKILDCQCNFFNSEATGKLQEEFHTYGVSWLPNGVIFYFDGVPIRHETRYVPAGCGMALILNMAVVDWARHSTDTMAVDYIRIYRPRQLPPVPVVQRPGGAFPTSEFDWLPFETRPGLGDQGSHQEWVAAAPPRAPHELRLQFTDNYNEACDVWLPLPIAGRWAPTWVQVNGTPELQIQLPAPDSLHWTVQAPGGRAVAHGAAPGGRMWYPRWAGLPPGSYAVHLRQGLRTAVQPLVVVGRPPDSAPTTAWQQPAPAPSPAE